MRFQFSLATLLVCTTVLAVVCAIAVSVKVHVMSEWDVIVVSGNKAFYPAEFDRAPKASEIAWRVLIWGTPAVAATLAVLWSIRRLKSRRENGPPVG